MRATVIKREAGVERETLLFFYYYYYHECFFSSPSPVPVVRIWCSSLACTFLRSLKKLKRK